MTVLDGWNKTLDILLIFAALFSAVVTTFVVESTSLLQPDSAAYAANALYVIANATSSATQAMLPVPPDYDMSISDLSRWVNRLWYTSLAFSLVVAFLCILAKQWITEYTSRNNASSQNPRHWARRHQLYSQAMKQWRVADFISVMPLMLHFALFLFFAGLAVSLWSADLGTAIWIAVLTGLLLVFYLVCTFLPLYAPERPTATPLVNQARRGLKAAQLVTLRLCENLWISLVCSRHRWASVLFRLGASLHITSRIRRRIEAVTSTATEKDIIDHQLDHRSTKLDADALIWLIRCVPDSDAVAVGWQAIGGLDPDSISAAELRRGVGAFSNAGNAATRTLTTLTATEVVRIARTALSLNTDQSLSSCESLSALIPDPMWDCVQRSDYPDMNLLWFVLKHTESDTIAGTSPKLDLSRMPSLRSTAKLLLCVEDLDLETIACILLSCDLPAFTNADSRFLLQRLLSMGHLATVCSYVHTRSTPCSVHCLVDIVARELSDGSRSSRVHMLLDRLISRSNFDSVAAKSYDWSSLVTYMASERFIQSSREGHVARSYLYALVHTRSARSVYAGTADDSHVTEYIRALTMGVHACGPYDVGGACGVCQIPFGASPVISDHTDENVNLELVLELVLCRPVSDAIPIALWEMIAENTYDPAFGLSLVVTLASALCIHSQRGNDATALSDKFFGAMQKQSLLRLLERKWSFYAKECWGDQQREGFEHLSNAVRHLKALRPTWWTECLAYVESSEAPTRREATTALEALVQEAGACRICRRV